LGNYCLAGFSPTSCPVGTYNPFLGGTTILRWI
jgi:hypothetical protein